MSIESILEYVTRCFDIGRDAPHIAKDAKIILEAIENGGCGAPLVLGQMKTYCGRAFGLGPVLCSKCPSARGKWSCAECGTINEWAMYLADNQTRAGLPKFSTTHFCKCSMKKPHPSTDARGCHCGACPGGCVAESKP